MATARARRASHRACRTTTPECASKERLPPSVRVLRGILDDKAQVFAGIIKIGRTHLQDATPLTLGQEISGWWAQLSAGICAVEAALPPLRALSPGGTAVGTGLNTHPPWRPASARQLKMVRRGRRPARHTRMSQAAPHAQIDPVCGTQAPLRSRHRLSKHGVETAARYLHPNHSASETCAKGNSHVAKPERS